MLVSSLITPTAMNPINSYLDVLQNLHTAVVIHAADTRIVFSNRRATELLGLSEAQMLGKMAIDPGWHFVNEDGQRMDPSQYPVNRVIASGLALEELVLGVFVPQREQVLWLLVTAFPEYSTGHELQRVVVNFHDISALRQAQATLRASERTYRTLFETVPQGIVYQDTAGHITTANPAALRILGLTLAQLQGRTSMNPAWKATREDGSDLPGEEHPSMRALRTQRPVNGVVMGISAPGRGLVWILSSATPLFLDGELSEVYAIFEDITERKNLEMQVEQLAFFDPLTQLPNRRLLNDRLAQALLASKRSPCFGALLVIDLDNFKPLNDQHGHMAGDLLLVEVARRLLSQVRKVDTVARFGGDEFVVILQELCSDAELAAHQAMALAEKICVALAAPYHLQTTAGAPLLEHHCTASLGLALFDPTTSGPTEVLQQADQAMYQAKAEDRNRVHWAPRP